MASDKTQLMSGIKGKARKKIVLKNFEVRMKVGCHEATFKTRIRLLGQY